VLAYFFTGGIQAVVAALVLSGAALFAIGTATSFFTGRSILFSGARQLLVGYAAAGVTFSVGHLIGVVVGG
jgi:VIT1/CCC1 family predicted Fe2+/Mn2+ transporter